MKPNQTLTVTTYNIHKGFSQFNRRMVIHELRERLRQLDSDIVFLQEVQGMHMRHAEEHEDWPGLPQHEFLAEDVWRNSAYGRNVVYDHGHHGNAILSRFPILSSHNQDVTHLRFERRGLLHAAIEIPGQKEPLHCVCVHLSLFGRSRRRQMSSLADHLEEIAPGTSPLIVAGDFNDWRNRAHDLLVERLGMIEVFCGINGHGGLPPRSYPSGLPVFRLDRIYVRGYHTVSTEVHYGQPWSKISDHAALSATLAGVGKRVRASAGA